MIKFPVPPKGMSQRKAKKDSKTLPKLTPRRRGQGDAAPTMPKSYTLPFPVIVELRRAVAEYGSQGRALQVASEIMVRMKKRPSVEEPDPETQMRMTYKLLPRTIELIEELARAEYGTPGQAIAGCVKALKMTQVDFKQSEPRKE
jgi:hypothetical protein